jgi:diguanylate cyclase (GGDEF)-like protein
MRTRFHGRALRSYQRHFCHQRRVYDTCSSFSKAGAPRPIKREMDFLSDLPNAETFAHLLAREEMRRSRTGESLAVAVLDLDGIRAINARHGAAAGTDMLRRCAEAVRSTIRAVDQVARTGPDDFSVLLHATDSRSAQIWADRFEEALVTSGRGHLAAPVTCSVGLADSDEAPTLLEVAARARKRMEVVQTVRKLRRAREGGS